VSLVRVSEARLLRDRKELRRAIVNPIDPLDDDVAEPPPDRPLTGSEQKLQRWVDLLAALLVRQRYATFDDLVKDVPGYDLAHGQRDSVMRTFERDKDELRRFGVPIETVPDADGEPLGYRLRRKAFYLPYLLVSSHERSVRAPRQAANDSRVLQTLAFEPDELDALIESCERVRSLGDPVLVREADAAIRKLSLDLPLGAVVEGEAAGGSPAARPTVVPPRRQVETVVFERLSDALARHKVVTFEYHTMERDEVAQRTVEPYGLFFVSAHWYLAARDVDRGALRNFRLSRISHVKVNTKKAQTADYEVPPEFVLRDHAQAREPWEIGDAAPMAAVVEFTAVTGATRAALELGRPVPGSDMRREFAVRRPDAFARWLLSFGGDARPIEPAVVRAELERVARETLARYARPSTNATSREVNARD
jgi:predicted DNA-binding transcriptional regulator YafY